MTIPVDRELAEEAQNRANEKSNEPWDIIGFLCPACNKPVAPGDPDPNQFIHDEDDGKYGNDRAAYELSPTNIIQYGDKDTAWNEVHVVPVEKEFDDGTKLQVDVYKHDHSDEAYQAWKKELDELKKQERRASENQGLGDFV